MNITRISPSTTLLSNGKVLVAGGNDLSPYMLLASAEIYEPASGTWKYTGSLNYARDLQQATLLQNRKVLIAGGNRGSSGITSSAELYDPITGIWTFTGSMYYPRYQFTMTLLPNGQVLAVGGNTGSGGLSSTELYNPSNGRWTLTGSLNFARCNHTAALLSNGKVLVTGGINGLNNTMASMELYDPTTGKWTLTGSLNNARYFHTATLLPNGQVLIAAGSLETNSTIYPLSSAELYDAGLGYTNTAQPQITSLTTPLNLGGSMVVTGAQFRGITEGSGGNTQDSSADYPLVQLRSLESEQTVFLSSTNWGTNSFASLPVWNFPPGYALATVFVNGIQSTSSIVNISVPIPTAPALTGPVIQTNGAFSFTFTNSVGALFGVRATTNLFMPQTNWTALGGVTEIAPGQFQFSDPQTTNNLQRFYKIYSP